MALLIALPGAAARDRTRATPGREATSLQVRSRGQRAIHRRRARPRAGAARQRSRIARAALDADRRLVVVFPKV
jgi:hypothetical protein